MVELRALVEATHDLEPLPASVSRLAALVAREDTQLQAFVEVISLDQALTGALLRAANSAAMGGRTAIRSVKEALLRLGAGTILSLAVGCSVRTQMSRSVPELGLTEGALWRHSVAAALAVEQVPACLRCRPPMEAFTAALLHDVGKLALIRYLDEETLSVLGSAREQSALTPLQAEAEVLGVHHGELGQLVAQHWGLPEAIGVAIAAHHAPSEDSALSADVVHLADVVANRIGAPAGSPDEVEPGEGTRCRLELTGEKLDRLCERVQEQLEDVLRRYGS